MKSNTYISVGELSEKAKHDLKSGFAKVNWMIRKVNKERRKAEAEHDS